MKQGWYSELVDLLVKPIELFIVWIESLNSGVKLGPDQTQLGHRAIHLVDGFLALPWIDTCKAYKLFGVFLNDVGYFIIGQWWQAGCSLCVPGKQYCNNVEIFIETSYFVHLAYGHFASEELFRGFPEWFDGAIEATRGRKMDVHVYCFGHSVAGIVSKRHRLRKST